jgi:hypothetical protein
MKNLRKVMVATPALTGDVSSWFLDSMVRSVKLCYDNGIDLCPVTLINESILPMARNELFDIAYVSNAESVIFIDSDQAWDPEALLEVVNSDYDVLGLPVVSKTDEQGQFNVKIHNPDRIEYDSNGYIKVNAIGTGFLKLSNKVVKSLWEYSEAVEFRGKTLRNVCKYAVDENGFIGEDIFLCHKIKELGYDIWLNPKFTCAHIGNKIWFGDFLDFLTTSFPRKTKGDGSRTV